LWSLKFSAMLGASSAIGAILADVV
jgi:hypothetical protein